jgi:hypothetical protein
VSESELLKVIMEDCMMVAKNLLSTDKELASIVFYLFNDQRGMVHNFVEWSDTNGKRRVQKDMQAYILKNRPMGALIISDAYCYTASLDSIPEGGLHFPEGLKDVPGRSGAIFLIGGCKDGVFCLTQKYNRTKDNEIVYEGVVEAFSNPDQDEMFGNVWEIIEAENHPTQ